MSSPYTQRCLLVVLGTCAWPKAKTYQKERKNPCVSPRFCICKRHLASNVHVKVVVQAPAFHLFNLKLSFTCMLPDPLT